MSEITQQALQGLVQQRVPQRLRERDHTVWRSDAREISDRLGWLDAGEFLRPHLSELRSFVDRICAEGYRDVVLLGMGGSSLGPEVLRRSFQGGHSISGGHPRLTLLDSTVPGRVAAVTAAIDPARTLFIVSSKSGGTIETLSFYRHFREKVEAALTAAGESDGRHAGSSFVAITDSGTPLERLAHDAGFRRVFLNPADIGGRYSVLSWFGMLPASLAGIDVARLLDSAANMRDRCLEDDTETNPGLRLGALLGAMTLAGRDKVTLLTPPPIDSFGLWVEQMIAESLGKEGRGIVPVAGEPLHPPDCYGNDRLFVYLRPSVGENTDEAVRILENAGHPVERLDLADCYDLGAEFFRWEYATAIAGSMIDVHPFDQPDVQGAKDNTDGLLDAYLSRGRLPDPAPSGSLRDLLEQAHPGDYLAIMSYFPESPEADRAAGRVAHPCDGTPPHRHHRRLRPSLPALHRTAPQGRPGSRPTSPAHPFTPRRDPDPRSALWLRRARHRAVHRRLPGPFQPGASYRHHRLGQRPAVRSATPSRRFLNVTAVPSVKTRQCHFSSWGRVRVIASLLC